MYFRFVYFQNALSPVLTAVWISGLRSVMIATRFNLSIQEERMGEDCPEVCAISSGSARNASNILIQTIVPRKITCVVSSFADSVSSGI